MMYGSAECLHTSRVCCGRHALQELFALDLKLKHLGGAGSPTASGSMMHVSGGAAGSLSRRAGGGTSTSGQCASAATQSRRRGCEEGQGHAVYTALGERLSRCAGQGQGQAQGQGQGTP